ncbi:hypothetical protein CF326_g3983 [Tilletia indica]|nr:hypothetical protein CF326_g3983 [Tilletia indica]
MTNIDILSSIDGNTLILAFKVGVSLFLLSIVLRPIIHLAIRPYSSSIRAVKGPPIQHPFWGSWPREAEVAGQFEKYMLKTIEEYGPVSSVIGTGRRPMLLVGDHRAANKLWLQTPYDRVPIIRSFEGTRELVCLPRRAPSTVGSAKSVGVNAMDYRNSEEVANDLLLKHSAHPAFTSDAVYNMTAIFHEKAGDLVTLLRQRIDQDDAPESKEYGTRMNIAKDISAAALDIIGAAGFDYQFNSLLGENTALQKAFYDCLHLLTTGTLYFALRVLFDKPVERIGRFLRLQEQIHLDKSKKVVDDISAALVQRAKSNGTTGNNDVLSLMVRADASDELKESERISDEELAQMVPVFLFAGQETTATAVSWSMLSLIDPVRGKTTQERLREELTTNSAWRSDGSAIDSLEVMRYHCPVRSLPRQAPYDDVLPLARPIQLRNGTMASEIHVKKGDVVNVAVSWMNRWLPTGHQFKGADDQLSLDPSVKELKGVWANLASFGCGPTQCIGMRMAIVEFKVLVANLVISFEILPPSLPHEKAVEIEAIMELVARPVVKGNRDGGLAMPVRLKNLV